MLWAEFGLASRLGQFTKLSTYLFRNMRTRCSFTLEIRYLLITVKEECMRCFYSGK